MSYNMMFLSFLFFSFYLLCPCASGVFSGYSGFLHQPDGIHCRLIGITIAQSAILPWDRLASCPEGTLPCVLSIQGQASSSPMTHKNIDRFFCEVYIVTQLCNLYRLSDKTALNYYTKCWPVTDGGVYVFLYIFGIKHIYINFYLHCLSLCALLCSFLCVLYLHFIRYTAKSINLAATDNPSTVAGAVA